MTLVTTVRGRRGNFEPWWQAIVTPPKELVDFWFDYPLEATPSAGPRDSLHYYIYSDRLFFDAMALDDQGIPIHCSRHFGRTYNPAYVAWYGLASLEGWLRGRDPSGQRTFMEQVEWLRRRAVPRDDGSVVWPLTFAWQEGECRLEAPWISAMAQGLAISALVRSHRITADRQVLELCRAATEVFRKNVEDGGVRTLEAGGALYEEYPGFPLPRVLDGYLFSLLGLYDYAAQTHDPAVSRLFADGIDGLVQMLPSWDYRGKWSWYGSRGFLCPLHYHKLNSVLLATLARLSGEPTVAHYARAWDPARLTMLDRAGVFPAFLVTKNRSRLKRLLRWRR